MTHDDESGKWLFYYEPQIVAQGAVGSTPIIRPTFLRTCEISRRSFFNFSRFYPALIPLFLMMAQYES